MTKKILFFTAALLFQVFHLQGTAYGQSTGYTVEKINSIENGYTRSIHDIVIDSDGYVWVATAGGLLRYDGSHFAHFSTDNKPSFFKNSRVDKLLLRDSTLYLLNREEGVLKFNTEDFSINWVTKDKVYDIALDEDPSVLYFINHSPGLVRLQNGEITKEISLPSPHGLLETFKGHVYLVIKDEGVFRTDEDLNQLENLSLRYPYPIPKGYKEQLFKHHDDALYYVRNSVIMKISEDATLPTFYRPCSEETNYVVLDSPWSGENGTQDYYNFMCDNRGFLGERSLNEVEQSSLTISSQIDIRKIVTIERNNSLIVGTNQGLFLVKKTPWFVRNMVDHELSYSSFPRVRRAIIEVQPNELLLLGYPEILHTSNLEDASIAVESINLHLFDALKVGNAIYTTTEGDGLAKLDLEGNLLARLDNETVSRNYYSIEALPNNTLIAGSEGLVSVVSTDFTSVINVDVSSKSQHLDSNDRILDLLFDHNGRGIWLATEAGTHLFDTQLQNELLFYSSSAGASVSIVNSSSTSLLQSPDGAQLYIGGYKGVDVVDIDKSMHKKAIAHADRDLNSRVTAMFFDASENLWIATYDGILIEDHSNNQMYTLDRSNGLINQEYNLKSAVMTTSGHLVFGGLNGYDVIDPSFLNNISSDNKIHLTKIEQIQPNASTFEATNISNETIEIEFRTFFETLKLHFSVIDPAKASNYRLEYKLDEAPWMALDPSNILLLSNLAPGTYPLKIRGYDTIGKLLQNQLSISIQASVPFYYKKEFYGTLMILFLILVIGLISSMLFKSRQEIKIKEEIASDLHDVVGTNLTRTSMLVRDFMNESNEKHQRILSNLDECNFSLRSYISSVTDRYHKPEELHAEMNDVVYKVFSATNIHTHCTHKRILHKGSRYPSDLTRDIKHSLYELCTNTLKHSEAENVYLSLDMKKNEVVVVYEDDGVLANLESLQHTEGYGLKNLEKRIKNHQGVLATSIRTQGHGLRIHMTYKVL